jgi:type IV fimbrial biogenesis protein FimT
MPRGFSLLEILITLLLITVITTLTIPNFQSPFQHQADLHQAHQLLDTINLARNEAILRESTTTLCGINCENWSAGQIIFLGKYTQEKPGSEKIISVSQQNPTQGVLHWRSSLHRDYLSFLPTGTTRGEDGTFWYCRAGAKQASWAVIVNQVGRARLETKATAYPC